MAWKEKHNRIMKNKDDIIKMYEEKIPLEEIAKIYKVSLHCIWENLKSWGAIKGHGIKYLLGKMLLELLF